MINKFTEYQFDLNNTISFIFLPGYTGGLSSGIIQELSKSLCGGGKYDVLGLEIEYSNDLQDVYDKSQKYIVDTIQYFKNVYPEKNINIIGKSLGGALALQAINELPISNLIILGYPVVLGWPQRISLLTKTDAKLPEYEEEWKPFLEKITKPVYVINGDLDDLTDNTFIETMIQKNNYLHLNILKNVDHAMKNTTNGKITSEDCLALIKTLI